MEIFEKRLRTFKPGFSELFYPEKNWLLNQTFFHSKYWFRKSRLITSTKLSQLTTDPSTFFSTSDMDKFKKSVDTTGNSALKLVKNAKFEGDTS